MTRCVERVGFRIGLVCGVVLSYVLNTPAYKDRDLASIVAAVIHPSKAQAHQGPASKLYSAGLE